MPVYMITLPLGDLVTHLLDDEDPLALVPEEIVLICRQDPVSRIISICQHSHPLCQLASSRFHVGNGTVCLSVTWVPTQFHHFF